MRDNRRALEVIGTLAVTVGGGGALAKWSAASSGIDLWDSHTFDALVGLAGVGVLMFFIGVLDLMPRIRDHTEAGQVSSSDTDAIRIEVGPCSSYNRSDYVQHISVTNEGKRATFSAQVTSNFVGLESEYGKGNELVWERPQATEKRLGNGQEGLLRLVSVQPEGDGGFGFTARFFASPEFRHKDEPGSYLPTMPYTMVSDALMFDFCVRNIEKDLTYKRSARMTLAPDGKPTLEISEQEPRASASQPANITAGQSINAGGEISAPGNIRAGVTNTELEQGSRRIGTELREIRLRIERVKATNPMVYPAGFRLPFARWQEYESLLAANGDFYGPVERAYSAVVSVNDVLALRESRQESGGRQLAVNAEDGLDDAHGLAGEALDALGEQHNKPFRPTSSPRGLM